MTDEPQPQYDASRVMLNGAAIGLVTNLVNGVEARLSAELHAVETRLSAELKTVNGDVDGLELWRADMERAKQRRAGQWSVFTNALAWAEQHRGLLAAAVAALLLVLGRLLGIEVTIAS
jgi:hypothetical protein